MGGDCDHTVARMTIRGMLGVNSRFTQGAGHLSASVHAVAEACLVVDGRGSVRGSSMGGMR